MLIGKRALVLALIALLTVGGAASAKQEVPGRLIFLSDQVVRIMAPREQRRVLLPDGLTAPALSPDGEQVAGLLAGEIWLIELPNGRKRPLGRSEGVGLAWSPSGDRLLAYHGNGDETLLEIHQLDGGAVQRIAVPAVSPVQVAWAPDDARLVLQVGTNFLPANDLWLVDLGEGTASLLAEGANAPTWSPDGSTLAYAKVLAENTEQVMFWREGEPPVIAISEESLARQHPEQAVHFEKNNIYYINLSWSPAGDRLVASGKIAGPAPRFGMALARLDSTGNDLWVLPLYLEHQEKRHGVYTGPPRPCSLSRHVWVRGGEEIAALLFGPGCERKLALVSADGLVPERELSVPQNGSLLASPEGDWVALTNEESTALIDLAMPDQPVLLKSLGKLIRWEAE